MPETGGRTVFLPTSLSEAVALRSGRSVTDRVAYAVTSGLAAQLPDAEEAEYAALGYAGIAALSTGADPLRLVLAVEIDQQRIVAAELDSDTDLERDDFGAVTVRRVDWSDVRALFTDAAEAAPAISAARAAAAGSRVSAALDQAAVRDLLASADLLWYDPAELDQLHSSAQTPGQGRDQAD